MNFIRQNYFPVTEAKWSKKTGYLSSGKKRVRVRNRVKSYFLKKIQKFNKVNNRVKNRVMG
jgi:hypothetical protein